MKKRAIILLSFAVVLILTVSAFEIRKNGHKISDDNIIDADDPAEPGDEGKDELPDRNSDILYQSDSVTVTLLQSAAEKQYSQWEWIELSESAAYEKNPIIFTGRIRMILRRLP